MKITNETKIGALTSISIVFLILGFNFLKGKDLFSHQQENLCCIQQCGRIWNFQIQ